MEFFLVIFLLGFAFSGNAKNALFDCYPNVILFYFRQVSLEQIPLIILTDINLRRPICDRHTVDLATANSVGKACCYLIQCIHLFYPSGLS